MNSKQKQHARSYGAWLALVLLLVAARPLAAETRARPPQLEGVGVEQKMGASIPRDARFVDSQGNPVRLGELMGERPVLLNLVYFECPMLCNMAMNGLIRALRASSYDAGEEFRVVTISFDPREGPEMAASAKRTALQRYGRPESADDWYFLTGEEDQIRKVTEAVGFNYRWDPRRGQYAHAACLIVLTPEGRVSRYLLGVDYVPRDLQFSVIEASNNKVGSVSDQILLLCFQYDPSTGKYGLLIHRVLQISGTLFATVLGCCIGFMLWRERRRGQVSETSAT